MSTMSIQYTHLVLKLYYEDNKGVQNWMNMFDTVDTIHSSGIKAVL